MISMKELNPKGVKLTPEMDSNIKILFDRINIIRTQWNKPMTVTSGVRSMEDHKRIYKEIVQKKGLTNYRIPMGSKHLVAAACDIADKDGSLMAWCKANIEILKDTQLWCEDETTGWVHFQIYPPASGKRFFKP